MATTRLSDVIINDAFTSYVVNTTMEKTALLESGAIVRNAAIADQLAAGGDVFSVPAWQDLGNAEANIVNDDPEDHSVPQKITSINQKVRKSYLHQSWSAMQFAAELAGSNPLEALQSRVTAYWNRQLQRRIIATLQGVMANNLANNAGDMVVDISGGTGAAAVFNVSAVIDAASTLGDASSSLSAIFVHSKIHTRMLKDDLIEYVRASDGRNIATYRGLAVVVDDSLPLNGDVYMTALAGAGAIGFAMAAPRVADGMATEVVQSAGNGGGMEILHSRKSIGIHPLGHDWLEGTLEEPSPSIADLRLAAHWRRVVERKAVPIAFLLAKAA